jgi:hypothetical protein
MTVEVAVVGATERDGVYTPPTMEELRPDRFS